jgi:hypothetical protein
MTKKLLFLLPVLSLFASCYQQERKCTDFKTGKFEFEAVINGEKKISTFTRTNDIQIETFEGKTDTASVRWVNDCEFVLQKINPKNMAEQKAITMKIISTEGDTYLFEYGIVGDTRRERGTIKKVSDL